MMLAIQAATPGNKSHSLQIADPISQHRQTWQEVVVTKMHRLQNKVEIDFFDIGNIHLVREFEPSSTP